jgi:histone chaperone ASF1
MALVNVQNVIVMDNPSAFTNDFQFEVTFESLTELEGDLDWKVTYVGSASAEDRDQILEEVGVGPVPMGLNRFVLTASPPNTALIADEDLIGVTVILITCSYQDQEFIRIGYYVDNDYEVPVDRENPPRPVDVHMLRRNIMAAEPRVTRLPIDWTGQSAGGVQGMPAEEDQDAMAEAEAYETRNEQMGVDGEADEEDDDSEDGDAEIDISGEYMGNEDSMDVNVMETAETSA